MPLADGQTVLEGTQQSRAGAGQADPREASAIASSPVRRCARCRVAARRGRRGVVADGYRAGGSKLWLIAAGRVPPVVVSAEAIHGHAFRAESEARMLRLFLHTTAWTSERLDRAVAAIGAVVAVATTAGGSSWRAGWGMMGGALRLPAREADRGPDAAGGTRRRPADRP